MAHTLRSTTVLGVTALSLSALFSSEDLARTAARLPYGARRTAALAAVRPVASLSHSLYLDRPARWLAARVHPDAPLPPEVPPAGTVTTTPLRVRLPHAPAHAASSTTASVRVHRLRAPTAERPWVVWVGGDSLAQRIGEELVTAAVATGLIRASHDAHHATGLSRPDYFDWNARLALVRRLRRPDVMVLTLGTNDAEDLPCATGHCAFGSPGWDAEYRARLHAALGVMDGVPRVVWLTLPPMRAAGFDRKMAHINALVREAASAHPNTLVLDTAPLVTAEGGAYTEYLPDAHGQSVMVRESDGIHVAREGSRRIARAVLDALADDLPPEQPPRE